MLVIHLSTVLCCHQTFAHFAAAALLANQTADGFFLDLDLLPFGMEMGYPVRHTHQNSLGVLG